MYTLVIKPAASFHSGCFSVRKLMYMYMLYFLYDRAVNCLYEFYLSLCTAFSILTAACTHVHVLVCVHVHVCVLCMCVCVCLCVHVNLVH